MNRYCFLLIMLLQFATVEARWENKSIEGLNIAINMGNTHAVRKIIEHHPEYLNQKYQIFYVRYTPLVKAIKFHRYSVAKLLLELGCDPNYRTESGVTPLMAAVMEQRHFPPKCKEVNFVKLLIEYGAEIDVLYDDIIFDPTHNGLVWGMPLINLAANSSFAKLKYLVEHGANIEYAKEDSVTAAIFCLKNCPIEMAHYMIVEKKADITHPYFLYPTVSPTDYSSSSAVVDYSIPYYAVELLLNMVYRLDSEEYKLKMEIVEEFKRQGVDYQNWKNRIPKETIDKIKHLYGDDWEEYVEKY